MSLRIPILTLLILLCFAAIANTALADETVDPSAESDHGQSDEAVEAELEALETELGTETSEGTRDEQRGDSDGEDVPSESHQERNDDSEESTEDRQADGGEDDLDAELEAMEAELAGDRQDRTTPARTTPGASIRESASSTLQSMNPDISVITDFAFAWFSDTPDLVGGHDPGEFGFNLQGIELGLQAAVDPYFRFDSYIVFSLFGVEVEEAYATTLSLPWSLQLRAGQYLTNFGRLNPTHLHSWNFVTQPLVNGKFFGGEGLRGLGVEVSQILPLPWFAEWYAGVQNIGGGATGRSWLDGPNEVRQITDLTATTRIEQYWDLSTSTALLLGLNGAFGPNQTGRGNRSEVYGADLLMRWNPGRAGGYRELGWQTEFLLRRRQYSGTAGDEEGTVLQDWGGYSELYFSPNLFWRFGARYEFVTGVAGDYLDPDWDRDRQRVAANISYYPSHFSRIRLEYGLDFMPYRTDLEPLVHMAIIQLELVAGAHGAHDF